MAQPVGIRGQFRRDFLYSADGVIAAGPASSLVLPEAKARSFLYIQNVGQADLWFEFGGARATATLTAGVVTSITMTNKGFGYTLQPAAFAYGGGPVEKNLSSKGAGLPDWPAPSRVAILTPVIVGGKIDSITINDGGAGYLAAPYISIQNNTHDGNGCADPFYNSVLSGINLPPSAPPLIFAAGMCPTDAVAVYGDTAAAAFTCRYMF